MSRPAVFFDRDNTLIRCDGYLGDPAKVALANGAAEAVARVRALGFAAVVFSNQSGVARGMFGEEAVHAVNAHLDELLLEENAAAIIDRHEFCPFHPEAAVERYRQDSDLRKPKPGMIHQAARQLGLDVPASWVIGDAPRDIEAGQAAGCRTVLLRDPTLPPSPAAEAPLTTPPNFTASSLMEAVGLIERALRGTRDQDAEEAAAEEGTPAQEALIVQEQDANEEHGRMSTQTSPQGTQIEEQSSDGTPVGQGNGEQTASVSAPIAPQVIPAPIDVPETPLVQTSVGRKWDPEAVRAMKAARAGTRPAGGGAVASPGPAAPVVASPATPSPIRSTPAPVQAAVASRAEPQEPAPRVDAPSARRVIAAEPDAAGDAEPTPRAGATAPARSPKVIVPDAYADEPAGRRAEVLLQQILDELRRDREAPVGDFSVSKLLAGIAQILTLAALFYAYLNRSLPGALLTTLMLALVLQVMTVALLIMGRQR